MTRYKKPVKLRKIFLSLFISFHALLAGNLEYISALQKDLKSYLSINALKEKLQFSQEDIDQRGRIEIASFVSSNIWKGGYFEGNPLDPESISASNFVPMPY